ncbi:helix-turn-helix domain-containing protein [Salinibacter altiplanensis]|uniref:helix-turn-helix domain-containing protein n=1 Tax=Salinibacter altiplanensis TaxID=1803181 RepID=UPI000C9F9525
MSQKHIDGSGQPIEAFGTVLRRHRRARDLSQQKLGERCGLTQEYISGIECGKRNPTLQTIWRLAEGMEESPGVLLLEAEKELNA